MKKKAEPTPVCVLQNWVQLLPMMQQSVLLTAIRGPDGISKYHPSKMFLRWYRRCVLRSAMDGHTIDNPYDKNGGSFTGPSIPLSSARFEEWEPFMNTVVSDYLRNCDELPHHFQMHLLHAIEIVGYKHSDTRIRAWWADVYVRLVRDLHLQPETVEAMDERLGDSRDNWLKHADTATTD